MELRLVTPASRLPLALRDVQDHLYNYDDDRAPDMLRKLGAATEYCERQVCGRRQFMPATYDAILDAFPADEIRLPVPPLKSITSITYYDSDGTLQTLSSTAYNTVTSTDDPGFVEPAYGETWPSTRVPGGCGDGAIYGGLFVAGGCSGRDQGSHLAEDGAFVRSGTGEGIGRDPGGERF